MKKLNQTLVAFSLSLALLSTSAFSATYVRTDDLIGTPTFYVIKKNDRLSAIARRFNIGGVELKAANPEIKTKLAEGQILIIPTQHLLPNAVREGIVINLAELRLYDYSAPSGVISVPITVGTEGWDTPLGETTITMKRKNPTWTPPASIRAQNPNLKKTYASGPKNPLGLFALNLGWPGYLIHGTNSPNTIGQWASHGCIRLYPEDIKALYLATPIGTKVTIISARFKLGWHNNDLLIEVNPAKAVKWGIAPNLSQASATNSITQFVGSQSVIIDTKALNLALTQNTGLPTIIAKLK
jgi:L,D-transpeptidase ErfK/SrfK